MKVAKRILYRRIGRELANQELSHGSLRLPNNPLHNLRPGVSRSNDQDAEDMHRWPVRQRTASPETQTLLFETETQSG
jgi:hypothetical protein